ncbi:uncharacterized protein LOC135622978 [Musa acuminata AAA Group]|uniref:uncharacterized protein LOC135622978 n=1 Tax=Musa acuminata AAA Group TaxID=214697 RepID=UPI0031E31E76
MLSAKSPLDPSCSSKVPAPKTGETVSEKLASRERDPILGQTPTPNFSIRDYVFTSRSKGIETSWPFTQHFLQRCLKHGVKDLLPPFEPPDLVRVQCWSKGVESQQSVIRPEIEQIPVHIGPQEKAVNIRRDLCSPIETQPPDGRSATCQRFRTDELTHSGADIGSIITRDQVEGTSAAIGGISCSFAVNRDVFEVPSDIDVVEPTKKLGSSREPSEKKCRLIVRLGVISDSSRAEDIKSSSSTVSDPMASKVCPVCKMFSSTSNTTLNAHIDQCLSMESNTKCCSSKVVKPKAKPRKKRLMVDIYTTAPRCTLEDLDKRNGSHWAVELGFAAAPSVEVDTETKKPKLVLVGSGEGIKEGAVYVDSNGVKLGILSKLSSTSQSKEELKLQEHDKVVRTGKSFLIGKKKHFKAKYSKKMKMKSQRKKLNSFMLLKAKMQTSVEGDCDGETHHENGESLLHISDPGNLANSRPACLRQWICSRRSDLPKKLASKNAHSASDNTALVTRSMLTENSRPDAYISSVSLSHHLKFSRLSEDLTSSPGSKNIDILSKTVHPMDDGMKVSEKLTISASRWSSESTEKNSLLPRVSKSSGNFESSSRTEAKETAPSIQHRPDTSSDRTNIPSIHCPSAKDQIVSTLMKNDLVRRSPFNLQARKGDLSAKPDTCKKFRKHRSILRSGKIRAKFQSATNGVHNKGVLAPGADIARASKTLGSCELNHSCVVVSGTGEMTNDASPGTKDVPEFDKRDEGSTLEEQKHSNHLETKYHGPDVQNLDMQVEVLDSGNHVRKPSSETAGGNLLSNDTVCSESLQAASDCQSISKSEVNTGQLMQISEKQVVFFGDTSREEIDGQNIQMADKMEDRGEKDSYALQLVECTVETMSIQESSGCSTSHGNAGHEIRQKSSSITSVRTTTNEELAGDGEPCGSPDSTASTISLPSPKDLKYTDSDANVFASAINAENKLGSIDPLAEDTVVSEERNVKERNEELKVNLPAEISGCMVDDKTFCCSCRESLSREFQILQPNATHRTPKVKQVSKLFARPRVSSSFNSCQNHRINTTVISNLQAAGQPTTSKGLSDCAVKVPTCSVLGSAIPSSQSQNRSISNPILRLMGKNLMVMNNEEFVQPQRTVMEYPPNVNFLSPLGFALNTNHSKQENFRYHHKIFSGPPAFDATASVGEHQFPICMPSAQMAGFSVTPLHTAFVPRLDHHTWQKNACRRSNSSPASCIMNEVLVIDDPIEFERRPVTSLSSPISTLPFATSGLNPLSQRPFSCVSSQCQIRYLRGGSRPLLPKPSTGINANLTKSGSITEGHGPLPPSPFLLQTATAAHMQSSVCYSQLHGS